MRALEAGADDYVTKPFGPAELIARLKAALRRARPKEAEEPVLTADGLEVDLPARRVTLDGEEVHLTPDGVRPAAVAGARPRPANDPPLAAHRGLGRRVRARHPGAARAHRQPAQEDRARRRKPSSSPPIRASGYRFGPDPLNEICIAPGRFRHAAFTAPDAHWLPMHLGTHHTPRVWLRRGKLDRLIAEGPVSRTRRSRSGRRSSPRPATAMASRSAFAECSRPPRSPRPCSRPRSRCAGARSCSAAPADRRDLAEDLRGRWIRSRPAGVSLVERLLTWGGSPLYAPHPDGALEADLRHARAALLLAA